MMCCYERELCVRVSCVVTCQHPLFHHHQLDLYMPPFFIKVKYLNAAYISNAPRHAQQWRRWSWPREE